MKRVPPKAARAIPAVSMVLACSALLQGCAQSTWPDQEARSFESAPASMALWPESVSVALPADTLLVAWNGLPRGLACALLNTWEWEFDPATFRWEGSAEFRWPSVPDCALEPEGFDTALTLVAPASEELLVLAGRAAETRIRLQEGTRERVPYGTDSLMPGGFWFRDSTADEPRRLFGHSSLDACTLLEGAFRPADGGIEAAWGVVLRLEKPFLSEATSCDQATRADSIEVRALPASLPAAWPSRFRPE